MKTTLGLVLLLAAIASAHQSPADCNGNGVNVNVARLDAAMLLNGTVGHYEISVSNLDNPSIGMRTCDADHIAVTFHCPARDGTPTGATTRLATGLALPAGTGSMPLGTVACLITVDPGVTDAVVQVTMGADVPTPVEAQSTTAILGP